MPLEMAGTPDLFRSTRPSFTVRLPVNVLMVGPLMVSVPAPVFTGALPVMRPEISKPAALSTWIAGAASVNSSRVSRVVNPAPLFTVMALAPSMVRVLMASERVTAVESLTVRD